MAPSDAAFDLIVRGGSVFDGSGSAGVPADIGVRGERIAAIAADLPGHGQREVDARGLAVTPGFIDVHSHSDYTLLVDPRAASAIHQGVTLEVVGKLERPFSRGCAPVASPMSTQ